jgi:predicted  nucleic acid-binding Zn-ribbon protein
LLKEIEDVKEKNSKLEDKMLECLDRIEDMEAAVERKKQELKSLAERIDREKVSIQEKSREGEKRLALLDTERQKISEMVAPGLLKTFNTIKEKRKKPAIVPVQNAICLGCHMNIPPQLYNEIQRLDSVKLCPNCQRMLYWEEPSIRPE